MENDVVAGKETERATLWRAEERNERCVAKNEASRRESDDAVEGTSMRRTGESSQREGKRDRWRAQEKKTVPHRERRGMEKEEEQEKTVRERRTEKARTIRCFSASGTKRRLKRKRMKTE